MKIYHYTLILIVLIISFSQCTEGAEAELEEYIKQLRSDDIPVMAYAAYMIGEFEGDKRESIPALIYVLKYTKESYRLKEDHVDAGWLPDTILNLTPAEVARNTLVIIGEPAALPLIEALSSDDYLIRIGAAYSLGKIKDMRAKDPLTELMLDESEVWTVRFQATESLAQLGDPSSIDDIIKIQPIPKTPIRTAVPIALSYYSCDRSRELLIELLEDQNQFVRRRAAEGLAKNMHPSAYLPLYKRVMSPSEDTLVRNTAVYAFSTGNDSITTAYLIDALAVENERVLVSVIVALGQNGSKEAVEPMTQFLNHENNGVRNITAGTLGRIGDPTATKYLLAKLMENDPIVSGACALAIAEIGDTTAIDSLLVSLSVLDYHNTQLVCDALGKLTGESFGNNPNDWIEWQENRLR